MLACCYFSRVIVNPGELFLSDVRELFSNLLIVADLTSTVLGDIACDLGVTALFAAAVAAVGLALAHNKSRV